MKNIKRILAVVLSLTMVIGTIASVSAATATAWYGEAVNFIEMAGIDTIGNKAGTKINRDTFVYWLAKVQSHQLDDDAWNKKVLEDSVVFSDVVPGKGYHMAAIAYSYQQKWILGYGDGTYGPDDAVTLYGISVMLVRLMGYQSKVLDETKEYSWINVANNYCHAFDATFLKKTGTYDPDYELTYGEAAYVLATVMNFKCQTNPVSLTSEGVNLGELFYTASGTLTVDAVLSGVDYKIVKNAAYAGWAYKRTLQEIFDKTGKRYDSLADVIDYETREVIDGDGVKFTATFADGATQVLDVTVTRLKNLVLSALGISSQVDKTTWINKTTGQPFLVGDYVGNGSIVKMKLDTSTAVPTIEKITLCDEVVSDTFIVATAAPASRVPFLANGVGANYTPVFSTRYSDDLAISFTGVTRNAAGAATAAKLVFKGVTYKIGKTNSTTDTIVVYNVNDMDTPLSVAQVVEQMPNTAEGETEVRFVDTDSDGDYEVAYVIDYFRFAYREMTNADPQSMNNQKGLDLGGVIIDYAFSRNVGACSTDNWDVDFTKTNGKVTLLVCATNKRGIAAAEYFYSDFVATNTLPYYQAFELGTLTAGYIESVDAVSVDGYYKAVIANADGSRVTAYIPQQDVTVPVYPQATVEVEGVAKNVWIDTTDNTEYVEGSDEYNAKTTIYKTLHFVPKYNTAAEAVDYSESYANIPETQTFEITIAGASTKVTVNAKEWLPFITDYRVSADDGINKLATVADTAVWMVNKAVKYLLDADNKTMVLLPTTSDSVSGVLLSVKKTEDGDNTYQVSVGKDGATNIINNSVSFGDAYWSYTRWNSWNTVNSAAGAYGPNEKTIGEWIAYTGLTDINAWAASDWAKLNNSWTGNCFAYARNAVAGVMTGKTAAEVLDMTMQAISDTNATAATAVTNFMTNYKNIVADASMDAKLGDLLNAITGFDATVFAENVIANTQNVRTNANYGWWICWAADVAKGGYWTTSKSLFGSASTQTYYTSLVEARGAASLGTYKVRANASYMWDADNYAIYHTIFQNGTLIQNTEFSDATKVTGNDVIYVKIKSDATEYDVLQYIVPGDQESGIYTDDTEPTWTYFYASANGALGADWRSKGIFNFTKSSRYAANNWATYDAPIAIGGYTLKSGSVTPDATTGEPAVAVFTIKYGTQPYYKKTSTTGNLYELYWTTVATYEVNAVTSFVEGDVITTYIPVVDALGVQIKVADSAKADWEAKTEDANGLPAQYKVISGLLFKVNTTQAQYKYEDGKRVTKTVYDIDNKTLVGELESDVKIKDSEIVGLADIKELTPSDKGFYPGAYKVTYEGRTYIAPDKTPVAVLTPDEKTGNFVSTITTIKDLVNSKCNIFTSYQQIASNNGTLLMMTVIGEYVTPESGTTTPVTPTADTRTVYLGKAGTTIESLETGKYFEVRSNYSAMLIPSGEDVGSISIKYSTYETDKNDPKVQTVLQAGSFFIIDKNNAVVGTLDTSTLLSGSIKDIKADGTLTCVMNGKEVDATSYKWAFFYTDFDSNELHITGSSKNVTVISKANAMATFKSQSNAYTAAVTAYKNAVGAGFSAELIAQKKAAMDTAEEAYKAAKTNAVEKYLNGQFWGGANAPAYNYVVDSLYTYQTTPPTITFKYIIVDGVYCVMVDSFFA